MPHTVLSGVLRAVVLAACILAVIKYLTRIDLRGSRFEAYSSRVPSIVVTLHPDAVGKQRAGVLVLIYLVNSFGTPSQRVVVPHLRVVFLPQ